MRDRDRAELLDRVERLEGELDDCRRRLGLEPGVAPSAAREWEQSSSLLNGIILNKLAILIEGHFNFIRFIQTQNMNQINGSQK